MRPIVIFYWGWILLRGDIDRYTYSTAYLPDFKINKTYMSIVLVLRQWNISLSF